jgi:hypothetical protein
LAVDIRMPSGGVHYAGPGNKRHGLAVAPITRVGRWAVGLVAAILLLAVAVFTVVPDDSIVAWVVTFSMLALTVAGGVVLFVAIFRRRERALSVYAAALVLVAGVLFVLLHSLFISD